MAQEVGLRDILEQVNARFLSLEEQMREIRREMGDLRRGQEDIRREQAVNFRWLVGIFITGWAVAVSAIITFATIALTR